MSSTLKPSKAARLASKQIYLGHYEFSCAALQSVASRIDRPTANALVSEYESLFAPVGITDPNHMYTFVTAAVSMGLLEGAECRDWRTMALCLFASILESEGR